uniref:GH13116p n=1 Tax=Drosophila melanogaster TaxID=7227 RepID=Q95SN4_DROME|nr:GH13116p [Drosophila melanogaster]
MGERELLRAALLRLREALPVR